MPSDRKYFFNQDKSKTQLHQPANASRPTMSYEMDNGDTRRVSMPPKNGPGPGKGKPDHKTVAKTVVINILKSLFVLLCVFIVIGSILGVQVAQYVVESTADDDLVLNLDYLKVPQTGYILAQDPGSGAWVEYQKLSSVSNSIWVSLDKIPEDLVDAVISTEDRDFYKHGGFSLSRTVYAALNEAFHFRSTFGASTIDQQLVKNLTGEREVTGDDGSMDAGYKRKIREIFRAVSLNKKYSKEMILEAYLNTLPLSGTIVGVQAGAREYYNKDVGELTLAESAMIAGITQAPGKYDPYINPDQCKERRDDVLYFMLENDTISQSEYEEALRQPLGLYDGPRQTDVSVTTGGAQSYFSDTVFEAVVNDLIEKGIVSTREAAINYYYTGGLRIESTIDLTLQEEMERVYELGWDEGGLFPAEVTAQTEDGETVHPQSAMAVVRYDGSLAGVVGGIGEKTESLSLNRATQSPRPIGSTMKPVGAYALGIDYGIIHYSSLIEDNYVLSSTGQVTSNPDWPRNYSGAPSGRQILVSDAVAESLNTVPVRVATWVGLEPIFGFLQDTLEISSLVENGANNDMGYSSLVLGGMTKGVTAAELACAYTIFGGEETYGVFNSLHCYERVLDASGNIILEPDIASVQAIQPESAYIINRLLYNVLRTSGPVSGTANGMALETSESVAKTGTTSDDKDRWFVGLTPHYVTAVWWGYDTNELIEWSPAASTNPPPVVWKAIMDTVQAGLPEAGGVFPAMPTGVVERAFCRDSGLLASDFCTSRQTGYYFSDALPDTCSVHSAVTEEPGEAASTTPTTPTEETESV